MIKRVYNVPIYPGQLLIAIDDKLDECATNLGFDGDVSDFAAFTSERIVKGRKQFAVFMDKETTVSQIVHECKHIVNMIFGHCGQKLDAENDEAECYLLQWVFEKAHAVYQEYDTLRVRKKD